MLQGVKNIILDLGGVIINLDQNLTRQAFQNLFPKHMENVYPELLQEKLFDRFETGSISVNDFIARFQQYDVSVLPEDILQAWNSMLLDIPQERMELIARLRSKYRVFLLSNTNEVHYGHIHEYAKKELGISDFKQQFEHVYLSHEVKMRKPSVHIFQYVLGHSKLNPLETLFIDDSEEHILTAKQLGIKTHHLNLEQHQSLMQVLNEY